MSSAAWVIKSEDDAWNLLERTLKEGVPDGHIEMVFENWPVLEFKLKGDKFNSSLTVKVMKTFVDLQQKLNRAYAQMRYNRPTAGGLSAAEHKELEIVVKVDKGSTLFSVDLQPTVATLLQGVTGKMTGTEIVISVLGLGLIYGGVTFAKAYLDSRRQEKQIEIASLLSNEETKRLGIFADAVNKQENLLSACRDSEETFDSFIKGASDADYLEIGGQRIYKEALDEMVKQTRSRSTDVQLNGWYRILYVDSSKPDGFVVGVRSQENGKEFPAKLEDKWVFRMAAHLNRLQAAEWGKKPIYLRINGKEIRSGVSQATIIDVGDETGKESE
ncbi:hypothetical protein [Geobacter anodireducens]